VAGEGYYGPDPGTKDSANYRWKQWRYNGNSRELEEDHELPWASGTFGPGDSSWWHAKAVTHGGQRMVGSPPVTQASTYHANANWSQNSYPGQDFEASRHPGYRVQGSPNPGFPGGLTWTGSMRASYNTMGEPYGHGGVRKGRGYGQEVRIRSSGGSAGGIWHGWSDMDRSSEEKSNQQP